MSFIKEPFLSLHLKICKILIVRIKQWFKNTFTILIQALQQQKRTKSLEDLVRIVEESYLELKRETLENIFYTWLAVMEQVMLHEGSNSYKMPRTNKQQIRSCMGGLPQSYTCSMEAVTIAHIVLLNAGAEAE